MNSMAAIGDSYSLFVCKILGADIFETDNGNALKFLNEALSKPYPVILITHRTYVNLQQYINGLDTDDYSRLVPIPSLSDKGDYFFQERLNSLVSKAIGVNGEI